MYVITIAWSICRFTSWPFSMSKLKYFRNFSFEISFINSSSNSQILVNCSCSSARSFLFSRVSFTSYKIWFNFFTSIWNCRNIFGIIFAIVINQEHNVAVQTTKHNHMKTTFVINIYFVFMCKDIEVIF